EERHEHQKKYPHTIAALIHFRCLFEDFRRQEDTRDTQFLHELGADSAGPEGTDNLATGSDSPADEGENVLHADGVAFHAGDFGDIDHAPRPVAHAGDLHHNTDSGCDLLAHRL